MISGPVAVNVDRGSWGRVPEEATWARVDFAPLPTSKVSACQPTSVWILTQPRARSVSIQLSDLGLMLGLSLGPDPRLQVLLTSGQALVQPAVTAPMPEP